MKNIPPVLTRTYLVCMKCAMGAAIFLLPLTSLPALSDKLGGTMVAPPTIIFIFILTVGWLPFYVWRGEKFPRETGPLFVFVIVALLASAAAFFLYFPPYKGYTVQSAEVDAIVTLAIGSATFLVVSLWHRDSHQLVWTLRLINISGLIMLVWSFVQLAEILLNSGNYPDLMVRFQALLSTRSLLDFGFRSRVGGFTFEPSWQAHLLNIIYLPYWLAATVTNYSVSRKLWRFSVENALLFGGIIIFYFTISRIGLLAFLLVLAFLFYRINANIIRWLQTRLQMRRGIIRWRIDKLIPVISVIIIVLIYLGGVTGLLFIWAHFDFRTANLLALRAIPSNLFDFAFSVNFAERVVYWSIGWTVFAHYPFLGVGLGNTGFFFQQYQPNISYRLPEIMSLLFNATVLPNVKSFWIRLLSETGIAGFSVFAAWQVVLWRTATFLRSEQTIFLRTLGWMGAFAILAFLAEGFSIDSFALPYLWVAMGLLTAASALARRTNSI